METITGILIGFVVGIMVFTMVTLVRLVKKEAERILENREKQKKESGKNERA